MEQRFVRSLSKPSAYPEPTGSIKLVQTHVSYIFLTDTHAYKIKKPVDFGFLNFSTLDRRRFYCDEEVRLNRRLCPEIYLGVVEVREGLEGAAFLGDGRIIDFAVKMKRLPEERMLDRLLQEGRVTEEDVRAIARAIGDFHLRAGRDSEIDRYGSIETIRQNWTENFQQVKDYVGTTLSGKCLELIREWVERFILNNAPAFEARVAQGFIRDCDGDIHMENINLGTDGSVCIFDCIEFNNRFRYSDTAADIAFLLMDFDYLGLPILNQVLLDEYTRVTGDAGVMSVIDFYKVYRAFIRGKVESLRLSDRQISADEKEEAKQRAQRYFRLARGYVVRTRLSPTLITTCGLTGSGKSHLARELAYELGVEILSSDMVRKELAGIPPTARRAEEYNEGIYSADFTARTYGELLKRSEEVLAAGRSVIVDATFRRETDRSRFRTLADRLGVDMRIVHAVCPESLTQKRLLARDDEPGEASDGRWEVFLRQKEEFESPEDSEGTVIRIDTSKSASENTDAVLAAMGLMK